MTATSWGRRTTRKILVLWTLAMFVAAPGCSSDPGGTDVGNPLDAKAQAKLETALAQLSAGEFEQARNAFLELHSFAGHSCAADVGTVVASLAEVLQSANNSLLLVTALAPGYRPAADVVHSYLRGLVLPYEAIFAEARAPAQRAIAAGCSLHVPEGVPFQFGRSGWLLHVTGRIGYEFDAAAIRAMVAVMETAQTAFDLLLAHSYEVGDIGDVLDVVYGAYADFRDGASWIHAARQLGAPFDANPRLLAAINPSRLAAVDNDLAAAARVLYARSDTAVSGFMPDLMARNDADNALTDNVVSWEDDGDRVFDGEDTIRIGLRKLVLNGTAIVDSPERGVWTTAGAWWLDMGATVDAVHELILAFGDQMVAVDAPTQPWRRIGLAEVNTVIRNTVLFRGWIPELPLALEWDFRAFLTEPKGLRELLPYWYADATTTHDVFMLEGEHAESWPNEPFIAAGDAPHFPASFTFDTAAGDGVELDGVAIGADGVSMAGVDFPQPSPYVALQDPSLNGAAYVNTAKLPTAPEGPDRFERADLYTFNKGLNAYLRLLFVEVFGG